MKGLSRAEVDETHCTRHAGETFRLGVHVVPDEGIDYLVHDATGLNVGTVSVGNAKAIAVTALRRGTIGGIGIAATMSAEHARNVAAALIGAANELETAANEAAHAALRKAAGK